MSHWSGQNSVVLLVLGAGLRGDWGGREFGYIWIIPVSNVPFLLLRRLYAYRCTSYRCMPVVTGRETGVNATQCPGSKDALPDQVLRCKGKGHSRCKYDMCVQCCLLRVPSDRCGYAYHQQAYSKLRASKLPSPPSLSALAPLYPPPSSPITSDSSSSTVPCPYTRGLYCSFRRHRSF